ncbi:6353_t:CDS:2, partial [Funneliformis geosporum]
YKNPVKMVACIHDTYYDVKATLLSEADIKKIRESRGRIPNASQKIASKFHIGPKRQTLEAVSEVSSIPLLATKIPKKNG